MKKYNVGDMVWIAPIVSEAAKTTKKVAKIAAIKDEEGTTLYDLTIAGDNDYFYTVPEGLISPGTTSRSIANAKKEII